MAHLRQRSDFFFSLDLFKLVTPELLATADFRHVLMILERRGMLARLVVDEVCSSAYLFAYVLFVKDG